jgi:polynucleotide 5'-hydroxyl-kinase GRC3/NOL9
MTAHPQEIEVLPAWQPALDYLRAQPGTILVLGATDTGKSTLTRVVVETLQRAGLSLAWIDGDVGQSDLGPPTTIGMTMVTPSTSLQEEIHAQALRFVGSVSPSGHLLPMVVGTHRMVQLARARGAQAVVINTSGMVYGGPARALNLHLIDVIKPDNILALQRASEIEHLLRPIERQSGLRVFRLPVSTKVKQWSLDARRAIRQESFRAYFADARQQELRFSQVSFQNIFLGSGARLSEKQLADAASALDAPVVYGERSSDGVYLVVNGRYRGHNLYILQEAFRVERVYVTLLIDFEDRLLGLCDATNDLLALGLMGQVDWVGGRVFILTPLSTHSLDQVRVIQFGALRVDRLGQEHRLG